MENNLSEAIQKNIDRCIVIFNEDKRRIATAKTLEDVIVNAISNNFSRSEGVSARQFIREQIRIKADQSLFENTTEDLFSYPERLPKEVYDMFDGIYLRTHAAYLIHKKKSEALGYTFDYREGGELYNLRKI